MDSRSLVSLPEAGLAMPIDETSSRGPGLDRELVSSCKDSPEALEDRGSIVLDSPAQFNRRTPRTSGHRTIYRPFRRDFATAQGRADSIFRPGAAPSPKTHEIVRGDPRILS